MFLRSFAAFYVWCFKSRLSPLQPFCLSRIAKLALRVHSDVRFLLVDDYVSKNDNGSTETSTLIRRIIVPAWIRVVLSALESGAMHLSPQILFLKEIKLSWSTAYTRHVERPPWLVTNRQFQWTGNGHSQLPLAELGKPSPIIDLLRTTGSDGRA